MAIKKYAAHNFHVNNQILTIADRQQAFYANFSTVAVSFNNQQLVQAQADLAQSKV